MSIARPGPLPPLLQRYVFSWETMHTIIGGRSAIDLSHLRMAETGVAEAQRFVARYGYDIDNPDQADQIERIRVEALGFIRGVLLPGLAGVVLPEDFDTLPILQLLCLAAGEGRPNGGATPQAVAEFDLRMAWACATLRVMHTIAHAANYFQDNYYSYIRAKVLDRFVAQVHTSAEGSQFLHAKSFDVPLVRFEVKETKPLRSVVVKLLQKQENVAYDLFDHIGVRIIVHTPVDALFAVRALREEHTIMYPNVKPTRSRNTLIELGGYDAHVRQCLLRYQAGELDEQATVDAIHDFVQKPDSEDQLDWNPYSSDKYRSIQFTCRQMIRFANPLFVRLVEAQVIARKHLTGVGLDEMLASLSTVGVAPEIEFFFPYEVQVMDLASYQAATEGRASYADYKARQIASVRQRVMPRVLQLLGKSEPADLYARPGQSKGGAHTAGSQRRFASTGLMPVTSLEELQQFIASREIS